MLRNLPSTSPTKDSLPRGSSVGREHEPLSRCATRSAGTLVVQHTTDPKALRLTVALTSASPGSSPIRPCFFGFHAFADPLSMLARPTALDRAPFGKCFPGVKRRGPLGTHILPGQSPKYRVDYLRASSFRFVQMFGTPFSVLFVLLISFPPKRSQSQINDSGSFFAPILIMCWIPFGITILNIS